MVGLPAWTTNLVSWVKMLDLTAKNLCADSRERRPDLPYNRRVCVPMALNNKKYILTRQRDFCFFYLPYFEPA